MNDAGTWSPPASLIAPLADAPLVMVDVGARGGLQPRWQGLTDYLFWIAFEPDPRSIDTLDESHLPARRLVLPTALADARKTVTLHRTRDEGDSSILRPNAAFLRQFGRPERFDVVDTIELTADTLDAQLSTLGLTVDVLKLDTQGSELAILKGAASTLASGVMAVDVEVEFSQMYDDQPLFADVDSYLRPFDLQLFDISPRRWPYQAGCDLQLARGPVVWAEAVYLRTAEAIARDVAAIAKDLRPARLAKAATIALAYGFPDFALALIAACRGAIENEDAARFEAAVREWDVTTSSPSVAWNLELTPAQVRGLRRIHAQKGAKPTAQLRRAIRAWLASNGVN